VDVYLTARFPLFSRSAYARWLKAGQVIRDDRPMKPSSILHLGDVIHIYIAGVAPETPEPPVPEILHEDDRLIAVSKPSGMLCHPSGYRFTWGLIGIMKRARPKHKVDLVHRLDRETSGVMLLTKDKEANAWMKKAFRERKVRKIYKAIARGVIPWDEKVVEAPIGLVPGSEVNLRRGINRVDGSTSKTVVKVLKRLDGHTLVSCRIFTGRTHQIRVHMAHIGFPLLGDKLYGQPDSVFIHHLDHGDDAWVRGQVGFPRHALHAWTLSVPQLNNQHLTMRAPLPADMAAIVDGGVPEWSGEE
jgi:23S rRNA pseudouridine1911/1915/1917 synthase